MLSVIIMNDPPMTRVSALTTRSGRVLGSPEQSDDESVSTSSRVGTPGDGGEVSIVPSGPGRKVQHQVVLRIMKE